MAPLHPTTSSRSSRQHSYVSTALWCPWWDSHSRSSHGRGDPCTLGGGKHSLYQTQTLTSPQCHQTKALNPATAAPCQSGNIFLWNTISNAGEQQHQYWTQNKTYFFLTFKNMTIQKKPIKAFDNLPITHNNSIFLIKSKITCKTVHICTGKQSESTAKTGSTGAPNLSGLNGAPQPKLTTSLAMNLVKPPSLRQQCAGSRALPQCKGTMLPIIVKNF